jgi:hypothetical protein
MSADLRSEDGFLAALIRLESLRMDECTVVAAAPDLAFFKSLPRLREFSCRAPEADYEALMAEPSAVAAAILDHASSLTRLQRCASKFFCTALKGYL